MDRGILSPVKRLRAFARTGNARSVGILVSGTALAQFITLAALPGLTRLYDPEDFSVLAVYVSCVAIIAVAACLRLEIAIPLPQSDRQGADLLALALMFSAILSGVVAIPLLTLREPISVLLGHAEIEQYIWLVPLGAWMASSYAAAQYWATRQKRFAHIARTRFTQSGLGVGAQFSGGLLGLTPLGLLLGHALSGGAGVVSLTWHALRQDRASLRRVRPSTMMDTLREYRRFPQYSTIEALANTFGTQAPIIIIASVAVGPEAGLLMLAMRVIQAPVALLGGAVAQVFLSEAPGALRAGALGPLTSRLLTGLALTGVGPLICAALLAPSLFPILFGNEWSRAGEIVLMMIPWVVLQFLSSPVSMVMHVTGRQVSMLALMCSGLALRLGAILVAVGIDRDHITEWYVAGSSAFYLVCLVVFSRAAGISVTNACDVAKRAAPVVAAWTLGGLLLSTLMGSLK